MNNFLKIPVTLFIATAISAILITAMHQISVPILEARMTENLDLAFTEMYSTDLIDYNQVSDGESFDNQAVYQVTLSGSKQETVFDMIENGKNGPIELLIAYDDAGNLTNLQYLQISETPGIGSKVTEAPFIESILGQNAKAPVVDGIAGATISSSAVRSAVENSSMLWQEGGYDE